MSWRNASMSLISIKQKVQIKPSIFFVYSYLKMTNCCKLIHQSDSGVQPTMIKNKQESTLRVYRRKKRPALSQKLWQLVDWIDKNINKKSSGRRSSPCTLLPAADVGQTCALSASLHWFGNDGLEEDAQAAVYYSQPRPLKRTPDALQLSKCAAKRRNLK